MFQKSYNKNHQPFMMTKLAIEPNTLKSVNHLVCLAFVVSEKNLWETFHTQIKIFIRKRHLKAHRIA